MKRAFPIHFVLIFSVIGAFVSSMQAQSRSILPWQTDLAQPSIAKLLFTPGPLNAQAQVPFGSPASYNTLVQQRGLAAADLNGDGLSDVVAGTPNGVVVLINEGDGTFAQPALNTANFSCCASGIVAADFNHDDRPDVAIPAGGGIGILLNTGSGGALGPASYYESGTGLFAVSIAAGDFYRTGHNDIALIDVGFFGCCATMTIFKNQGNGTFVKTLQQPATDGGGQIISSDVNGDGYTDVITANANGNNVISVLINKQNGTFAPSQDYVNIGAASVAATDLNRDSRPDLVMWGWGSRSFAVSFAVLMNNGNGTFATPVYYDTTFAAEAQPIHIGLADFDGNGTSDIAAYVGFNPFRILILPGKEDGTFSPATTTIPLPSQASGNPAPLLTADLDGNGAVDLVAGDNTNNVIYAMLNQRLPPANLGLRLSTNRGGNTGSVTVTIFGQGFVSGTSVRLVCSGQSDIVGGSTSVGTASTSLTTTFNLSGAKAGQCSVIITQPNGPTLTVPRPFTIVQGGSADLWVDLLGWSTFRGGQPRNEYLVYGNRGNVDLDAETTIVYVSFPTYLSWSIHQNQQQPSFVTETEDGERLLAFVLPSISPGGTGIIPILLTVPNDPEFPQSLFDIKFWWEFTENVNEGDSLFDSVSLISPQIDVSSSISELACPESRSCARPVECENLSGREKENRELLATHGIFVNSCPCLGAEPSGCTNVGGLTEQTIQGVINLGEELRCPLVITGGNEIDEHSPRHHQGLKVDICPSACVSERICSRYQRKCDARLNDGTRAPRWLGPNNKVLIYHNNHWDIDFRGKEPCTQEARRKGIVIARDPNEKIGSHGMSAERWLSGEEPLRYSIFFENKPSATAPAQDVVITDQLDPTNLDLTTLSLGPITFTDKVVTPQMGFPLAITGQLNAEVDLRPANNLIVRINVTLNQSTNALTWRFTSIDPTTGEPPEDPLAGFLSPGAEGGVFFTVRPKNGRSTGTTIRNKATIVFDVNPPLDTQEWSNTLDNTKPSSRVLPLAATQSSTSFTVQWAGTDEGSGVRDFTVYVSDNRGPFIQWLTGTASTQAIFPGVADHTYSFFSVARDLTNNLEDAKSIAEATTRAVTNGPPLARSKSITVRADASCKASVTPDDVNDGSVDPDGDEIALTLTPAGPFALGPHTVMLTATDSHGASESVSAIITVTDQTPPTIINVSANPSMIWPPDRRMVDVFVGYDVADNCGQTVSRLEVSSNEPLEPSDVEIVDTRHLRLRAARRGGGNGRTYKITIIVKDGFGNISTKDVLIRVPHDQRN